VLTDIGLALPGMIVALGFAAAMGAEPALGDHRHGHHRLADHRPDAARHHAPDHGACPSSPARRCSACRNGG
jgi:hypothetical protein